MARLQVAYVDVPSDETEFDVLEAAGLTDGPYAAAEVINIGEGQVGLMVNDVDQTPLLLTPLSEAGFEMGHWNSRDLGITPVSALYAATSYVGSPAGPLGTLGATSLMVKVVRG